jgi:hypothetical protein
MLLSSLSVTLITLPNASNVFITSHRLILISPLSMQHFYPNFFFSAGADGLGFLLSKYIRQFCIHMLPPPPPAQSGI